MGKRNKKTKLSWLEKTRKVGLNPRNEIIAVALVDALMIGGGIYLYFMTKQISVILSSLLLSLFASMFFLSHHKREKKKQEESLLAEFVGAFSYFAIFVENGFPVYNALEEVEIYASELFAEKIKTLLFSIDNDKSLMPFLHFADEFPSIEVKQVMISIYKMVDQGGNDAYLRQFFTLFDELSSNERKSENKRKEDRFGTSCMLPLLDSGLTMMLIVVGVIVVIGEMLNGI